MSRGRHDPYSKAEVAIRGLACPFVQAGSEAHMSTDGCKPGEGFKETRLLLYADTRPPATELRSQLTMVLQGTHMAEAHPVLPLRFLPEALERVQVS